MPQPEIYTYSHNVLCIIPSVMSEEFCLKLPSELSKANCSNIDLTWELEALFMLEALDVDSLHKTFIPQFFIEHFICDNHCARLGEDKMDQES